MALKAKPNAIATKVRAVALSLSEVEKKIYQVRNQSPKDKIAFPIKVNDRLTGLRTHLEAGDGAPSMAYYTVYNELSDELQHYLTALNGIVKRDIAQLNLLLEKQGLQVLAVPSLQQLRH